MLPWAMVGWSAWQKAVTTENGLRRGKHLWTENCAACPYPRSHLRLGWERIGFVTERTLYGSWRSQILIFSQIGLLHENWKRNKQKWGTYCGCASLRSTPVLTLLHLCSAHPRCLCRWRALAVAILLLHLSQENGNSLGSICLCASIRLPSLF